MKLETVLAGILREGYNPAPPKQASPLARWLGINRTPPGMSQKLGNHLEDFFSALMGEENFLPRLDLIPSTAMRGVQHEGEWHQVDLLALRAGNFITREMKVNLQLDRGKKRDTVARDKCITAALEATGATVDGGIFCPFLLQSKEVGGLGWVSGLDWFCATFPQSGITPADFIALGRSPVIHQLLGL